MPAAERQQEPVDCKTGTSSGGVDDQLAGYRAWCSEPGRVLTWAGGLLK